jgi:hypothetical protein
LTQLSEYDIDAEESDDKPLKPPAPTVETSQEEATQDTQNVSVDNGKAEEEPLKITVTTEGAKSPTCSSLMNCHQMQKNQRRRRRRRCNSKNQ